MNGKMVLKLVGVAVGAFLVWNLITMAFIKWMPAGVVDPELGLVYRVNAPLVRGEEGWSAFVTDSRGFNNDDMDVPVDVLVIGDSMTEALQVPRHANFVSQTAHLLSGTQPQIRIYNAGHSGLGLADYLVQASGLTRTFQPKVIVVVFTWKDFGSDATETSQRNFLALDSDSWLLRGQPVVARKTKGLKARTLEDLNKIFPLVKLTTERVGDSTFAQAWGERNPFLPASIPLSPPPKDYPRAGLASWGVARLKDCFGESTVVLFIREAPRLGTPHAYQRETPEDQQVASELATACQEQGLVFIDTNESFQVLSLTEHRFPRGLSNSSPDDGHLNEAGHKAVASVLAPALLEVLK